MQDLDKAEVSCRQRDCLRPESVKFGFRLCQAKTRLIAWEIFPNRVQNNDIMPKYSIPALATSRNRRSYYARTGRVGTQPGRSLVMKANRHNWHYIAFLLLISFDSTRSKAIYIFEIEHILSVRTCCRLPRRRLRRRYSYGYHQQVSSKARLPVDFQQQSSSSTHT